MTLEDQLVAEVSVTTMLIQELLVQVLRGNPNGKALLKDMGAAFSDNLRGNLSGDRLDCAPDRLDKILATAGESIS